MKKIIFIILILFAVNATASSLPNCPSDQSKRYHNCFGTINLNNGDKYIGEFKDAKRHGQGTYTFYNGNKYVGEFKDDKMRGQGTYTFYNGEIYVGEFKDDKPHGKGTYAWTDGDKYLGEYKDAKMHGQGIYTFNDGIEEYGYFLNDRYVPKICTGMGLIKGTESFGQCVVKLIKQINEDY